MSNPIYTLTRLLTTIQRFDDIQTDKLGDLLDFSYGPDDAYEALNLLQALRDLPEDLIERVRKYIEAVADFPTVFAKKGVIASIPVIGKDPIELNANDVQRLLRAAGVFKIGAGKVRIGHPTKGVPDEKSLQEELGLSNPNKTQRDVLKRMARIDRQKASGMIREQARGAGVPEDLIEKAAELGHDLRVSGTWQVDEPAPVRAAYVAEASLAEELAAADYPLTEGAEDLLKDWELLETADAWVWAREFVKRYAPNWTSLRLQETDAENLESLMLSWFASALETGKHFGAESARERLIHAEEEKALRLLDAAREQAREDEREQEEAAALVRAAVEREEKNAKERMAAEKERVAEERRNRREALLAAFRERRGEEKSPLEAAVDEIMDLQECLNEPAERSAPPELIGFKIVPKNAVVFDVDDVNKRVAAAMAETMETLRKMGLG
jgi:hypothetical protein